MNVPESFSVPDSVRGLTPLVGKILEVSGSTGEKEELDQLYLLYNRSLTDIVFTPISQRLLPLDEA